MRVMNIMTLSMFAFYLHVVFCDTLDAPAGDAAMLENASCSTEQITEYNWCSQTALVTLIGNDVCEKVGKLSHCWPQCFCDHPQGYQVLTEALKSHCTEIPPCVADTQRRKLLRVSGGGVPGPSSYDPGWGKPQPDLYAMYTTSPAPVESSPASALRANACIVCIAAVVSLVDRTS